MEGEGDPAVRRGSANRMKNRGKKGRKEGRHEKERKTSSSLPDRQRAQGSLDKPDTAVVAAAVAGREEMRQLFVECDKLNTNWVKTPWIKLNGSKKDG